MTIELYPHNQETYDKIQEMWKTINRVAVIQATGTGKSFIILKCMFDLSDKKKVVLAPTEYIFEQLVHNTKKEITNVEFITYAKIANMTIKEIESLNPSLIVLDEFHRCGAEHWGKGVQNLLDIFPDVKVLGTSATPIRYLDNERDMSDELFDGNMAVNLSLAEAIVKGILPMPKYISALYTFDEEIINLKNKIISSHNPKEEKEKLLNKIELMRNKLNKSKGIPVILQKYLTHNNDKFIVFCKNKEHLNEMKSIVINWFKKTKLYNKIEIYTVYNGYENINIEFEAFKNNKSNSLKLLFVIDMLNEGIHIEDISGVILLRPTVSPIIYYQQIGRAIDAGNKNEPIIFDFVNNFDNIGAEQFINDLKKNREKEICYREKYQKNEDIDIPEFIIYDEILDIKKLFNNIESDLHLKGDWDIWYEKLRKYYLDFKTFSFPKNKEVDKKLKNWVTAQRVYYKENKLSKEKIQKLNNINFTWNFTYNWDYYYEKLFNYYTINNHSDIKKSEDIKLGNWTIVQRRQRRNNKLTKEQIIKLNQLNFKWNVDEEKWEKLFLLLVQYKDKYGNCMVPVSYIIDDYNLGKWVHWQRKHLKDKDNDKVKKLNKIGFIWKVIDMNWEDTFNNLLKFKTKNGYCDIPKDYKCDNGTLLFNWFHNQKTFLKKGKLSSEKIKKFENAGILFNQNRSDYAWYCKYEEYINYLKENQTDKVKKSDNLSLWQWGALQRHFYKKGKLSQEKIVLLKGINFDWNPNQN